MSKGSNAEHLTHIDTTGAAHMVDVSRKEPTTRTARATGRVRVSPRVVQLLRASGVPKGDALAVARLAGIMGAKRTPDLIPLCHPLALSAVSVDLVVADDAVQIAATVRTTDRTGVEMEALTAVSVAALAVVDMVKAVDKGAVITDVRVETKTGGASGDWHRTESVHDDLGNDPLSNDAHGHDRQSGRAVDPAAQSSGEDPPTSHGRHSPAAANQPHAAPDPAAGSRRPQAHPQQHGAPHQETPGEAADDGSDTPAGGSTTPGVADSGQGGEPGTVARRALAITVSNRASAGIYADLGGPLLVDGLTAMGFAAQGPRVVPDGESVEIALRMAIAEGYDIVLTTGGTGVSPTDRTPEMTRRVLDYEIPGIAEAIRAAGRTKVPTASLSRGIAGVAGHTIVVNLPGSTGGVRDGLAVLAPLLGHAADQVHGGDHPPVATTHQGRPS